MKDWLQKRVNEHRNGKSVGVFSVCSAHPVVLQATATFARDASSDLLVESTCNQVNQDGGYTGMSPADFVDYVTNIAKKTGLPSDRIMFGGDHLGPYPWSHLPAEQAMNKASELVKACVTAGYSKIHIDTSMKCADDPAGELCKSTIAERTARLCLVAEAAFKQVRDKKEHLSYIIGTEVPTPGGIVGQDTKIRVTTTAEVAETIDEMRRVFWKAKLEHVWAKVIALVVQPGVEFGDNVIQEYDPELANSLASCIEGYENLVFEAHSTDYQLRESLRSMVRDHFMILKVGPALTYKYREAVYALAKIEEALFPKGSPNLSHLIDTIEAVMVENPNYWKGYYQGTPEDLAFARHYSFSDRIRYYWPDRRITRAVNRLLENLRCKGIPLSLISQFLPIQYQKIRNGSLAIDPYSLIVDHIQTVLWDYLYACEVN